MGLVWEDKPEDVEERLRDELPILTEVPERAIISEDKDAPNHILIEGDNLEALATLAYTHEGKIDVIYIRPPYNTGNKDFIYNDSHVDKEDGITDGKAIRKIFERSPVYVKYNVLIRKTCRFCNSTEIIPLEVCKRKPYISTRVRIYYSDGRNTQINTRIISIV